MKIKVKVGKADFNKSPHGNSKNVVWVEFDGAIHEKTGKVYKWMPSYEEMEVIRDALKYIERESWE